MPPPYPDTALTLLLLPLEVGLVSKMAAKYWIFSEPSTSLVANKKDRLDGQEKLKFPTILSCGQRYYKSIDGNPDLVLIDGRFRVACALYTWFAVDGAAIVLFDDFFDRPFYHVVLEYYNVLEKAGRLAVLQKKLVEPPPDIIEKYSTDPR